MSSAIGTWIVNETLALVVQSTYTTKSFKVSGVYNSIDGTGVLVELPFTSIAWKRTSSSAKNSMDISCPSDVVDYTFNSYYVKSDSTSMSGDIRVSYTSSYSLRYFGSSNANFEKLRTFTITGGTDVENATFISYLEQCATKIEVSTPSTINYNGTDTELNEGQTATLHCANKKAESDIVVAFGSAGNITYNGTETSIEGGKTATLQCNGKKMKSDVVIAL